MLENNDIRKKIAEGSRLKHLFEALIPFGHIDDGLRQDYIVENNTPEHLKNGAVWETTPIAW
jgi:hypothetical protein